MILIYLMTIPGCDREEADLLTVSRYISLLKSNQFDASALPEFDLDAIPDLLNYRNENQLITNFPRNPVSSFAHPECKLGMYVLWTIESIRTASNSSSIMRFPSQNPILQQRETGEIVPFDDSRSHEIVAHVYLQWWESNKFKDLDELKTIDPLANTEYHWH